LNSGIVTLKIQVAKLVGYLTIIAIILL